MDKKIVDIDKLRISPNKKASIIIVIFSCFFAILFGIWDFHLGITVVKSIVYTAIIEFVILFYMNLHRDRIFIKAYAWRVVAIGFLFSFSLLLAKTSISSYPLWMLGCILIIRLVDANLGLLITYSLLLLSNIIHVLSFEIAIMQVIVGTILCICVKYLNKLMNTIYVCVILLSTSLTLILIQNNFVLGSIREIQTMYFIGSSMIVVITTYIIRNCLDKKSNPTILTLNNFLEITDEKFPLLKRLKQEAPKLYNHSMLVANISKNAANSIKADENLAYAGALYHEIGRLEGNDYITLGLNLLDQFKIPNEIKEIVKQHNCKSKLPKTKEAAIVLLSDNVISTIDYLRNTENTDVSYDKVIESILLLRFQNGTLDQSEISLQEYNKLKKFYMSKFVLNEVIK